MYNAISIGKDLWLDLVDHHVNGSNSFDPDPLLQPSKDFWDCLEVNCVTGCCGVDAFSFWKEDVQYAAEKTGKEMVLTELGKIKRAITVLPDASIESRYLCATFGKTNFVQLLDHLVSCIE